jgi:hypothetical protein
MGGIPVLAAVSAPSSVARSNAQPKISSFGGGRARSWTPRSASSTKPGPKILIRDLDVVRGSGTDWGEAVNIAWESGDMLLGSGAAGPMVQVFLGSAASKILGHAPVPVMIVPRHRMPTR